MTTRLEPGPETIVGKPVYVVWDEPLEGAPNAVELRAPGQPVTTVPFKREGSFLKAEIVTFRPGNYRIGFANRELALTVTEAKDLTFLQEFSWTVFAVAAAFAIGLSWRRRFRGREHASS